MMNHFLVMPQTYYGVCVLLLVVQIILLVLATVKKNELIWGILFGLIILSMVLVLCGPGKTPIPVNEFYEAFALLFYGGMFLLSLCVRTYLILIGAMGHKEVWISVWVISALAVFAFFGLS